MALMMKIRGTSILLQSLNILVFLSSPIFQGKFSMFFSVYTLYAPYASFSFQVLSF
jgi:hypothetical protein